MCRALTSNEVSGGAQDLLEQNANFQTGLFRVLFILSQDRHDVLPKYAVAKVLVEWLQLFLLLVLPVYGWTLNTNLWLWDAVYWLQFRIPIIQQVRC